MLLTNFLKQVLVGQLIRDGSASKSSPTSNTRITWSFGLKYEAYRIYVAELFSEYCGTGIYFVKTGIRLKTRSFSVFNEYYNLFYHPCPFLFFFPLSLFLFSLWSFLFFIFSLHFCKFEMKRRKEEKKVNQGKRREREKNR